MVTLWRTAWSRVDVWFPDLPKLVKGGRRENLGLLYERIAWNRELVQTVYAEIRKPWMPEPDVIAERWATYRRIQTHLLAAVEYTRRYGPGFQSVPPERMGNFYLDLEYVTIGVLGGAIATDEVQLQDWFQVLAPQGTVVSG